MKPRPEGSFANLIPELSEWNNGDGISVDAWICCVGDFEHAIGYGRVFWPNFEEHDGCVFAPGFSVESYIGFIEQCNGDKKRVEAVMNHVHIRDLFPNTDESPTHDQIVYIGRLLKEIWGCKLQRDFPDRRFVFSFPEGPYDDPILYELTFFQEWPSE